MGRDKAYLVMVTARGSTYPVFTMAESSNVARIKVLQTDQFSDSPGNVTLDVHVLDEATLRPVLGLKG